MKTTTLLLRRALLFCVFLFGIVGLAFADGGIGYKGIKLNLNGTANWYNVHGISWGYQGCGDYGSTFYNSGVSNWSGNNLGTYATTATLQIKGYAIVGWASGSDYIAGKLEYKVWKQGNAEPVAWSVVNVGNYQSPVSGAWDVACSSGNDRVVGFNNGSINIQPGVAGTYNFKVKGFGRVQYTGGGGGSFNPNDGAELSASFTVVDAPIITSTLSSITSNNTQTYAGATISINGSTLGSVSSVKIGGPSGISCSNVQVVNSTQVTATVPNGSTGGSIWISDGTYSFTSSDNYSNLGFISMGAGDWNLTTSWLGGALPTSGSNVTIDHAITVNNSVSNVASAVTINNSKSLTFGASGALSASTVTNNGSIIMTSGGTITIAAGGTLANGNNMFTGGAGTITFAGTGTVNGTIGFNNVTIAGGVSFGTAATVNGTLTINTGGFVNASAPFYATGSILKYNTASVYGRGAEWSATSGAGYPHHVQISNGTTLNLGANLGTATARQIAGNLTVESGSVLSMNLSPMSAALTVKGSYLNLGTTNLSSVSGGDLILEGDLTDNGTFAANGRAVFFHGGNTQAVTSSDDPLDIDVVRFNKTGGEVVLLQNLLIDETADPVQFAGTSILNLNGKTATFGKASTASSITMNSSSAIKGSATSGLTILGTGAFGSIYFDQSAAGSTNVLGTLTINRTNTGSVTIANDLQIAAALVLTDGTFSLGANTLHINGSVSRTSGTINASAGTLAFGNASNLSLPTSLFTGNILNFNKMSGAGTLTVNDNIVVTNTMGTAASTGALILAPTRQLTVQGVLNNNGTFTLQNDATFVQPTSGNGITGTGTYVVDKTLTGNSSTWNATSGRFWYMGVPMNAIARSSFGNYAAGSNRVWSYNEISKQYTDITSDITTLVAGTGYVHRRATDGTLTFAASGANGLFSSDLTLSGLTRTPTSQVGFNLIANPYMAYLDWDAVTKVNVEPTYYLRSHNNTANDISALITYNALTGLESNNSSISSSVDFSYLAPLQGIWVRVGTAASTGSLSMTRSMLSHQTGNPGLKNATIFPTLARVNLVDGARFDQMLVFMNQDMVNGVDQYDSEKMFVSGNPQIYTMAAGKKLVMNGLNSNKKKISVPLYLELPESKVYNLQLAEYQLEDGLILLEDKQEGTIQDFTIQDTYAFYANSGVLQNRFVLHFYMPDATITAQGPSNTWVEDEATSYTEGGNIVISSDAKGKVQISLDQPETEKVEGTVQATDANGRVVYSGMLEGLITEFQLNVPSGIYYLTVQSDGLLKQQKVFVQE